MLAVDIGGTKLAAGVVGPDGTVTARVRMLGRAVAAAVTLVDVSVVTVGGGVAQSGGLLFAPLQAAYARCARFPYARAARIVPAALGATGGLLGAAALVLAGDRYWNAG